MYKVPSSPASPTAFTAKILILGSSDVGKTCLATQYVHNKFLTRTSNTIGACFLAKQVSVQSRDLTLQLWDTAGHERFRSMLPLYYRGAHAAILVFDVSNAKSFEDLKTWIVELNKHMNSEIVLCVVCNKIDLETRAVSSETGQTYAKSVNALYFETSAKTKAGVLDLFGAVAQRVVDQFANSQADSSLHPDTNLASLENNSHSKQSCCGGYSSAPAPVPKS